MLSLYKKHWTKNEIIQIGGQMKLLQMKHSHLKQQWQKISEKERSGSGLAFNKDPVAQNFQPCFK